MKGLKNTYTLAACVYEKGPQTLAEAITEVYGQCNVQGGRPMLPMSRIRSHCPSLPKHMLF